MSTMYEQIRELFMADAFARGLGIEIVDIGEGHAAASLRVTSEMLNGAGVANGGVTFTLADYALAIAANTLGQNISLTANMSISFCGAVRAGDILTAEARADVKSSRTAFLNVKVLNQSDAVIALAQGLTSETSRQKPQF